MYISVIIDKFDSTSREISSYTIFIFIVSFQHDRCVRLRVGEWRIWRLFSEEAINGRPLIRNFTFFFFKQYIHIYIVHFKNITYEQSFLI